MKKNRSKKLQISKFQIAKIHNLSTINGGDEGQPTKTTITPPTLGVKTLDHDDISRNNIVGMG